MIRASFILYIIVLIAFSVFSWLFIDANFPLHVLPQTLRSFTYDHKAWTVGIYTALFLLLFFSYGVILWNVRKKRIPYHQIIFLIASTVIVLFFSFPAFSFDIFNYIATAKITFLYKENPYIVMPIEIPNESMLTFMHAANKTALYAPLWIGLTGIPLVLGVGNLMATIFTFKMLTVGFYVLLLSLIWRLSGKNVWSLAFFGLNPLVVTETLISSHNDVVMMAFALGSYYFLKKNKFFISFLLLLCSIFIKFATSALLPIFFYFIYARLKKKNVEWQKIFT